MTPTDRTYISEDENFSDNIYQLCHSLAILELLFPIFCSRGRNATHGPTEGNRNEGTNAYHGGRGPGKFSPTYI
jgi:hypothetical protein